MVILIVYIICLLTIFSSSIERTTSSFSSNKFENIETNDEYFSSDSEYPILILCFLLIKSAANFFSFF